MVGGSLGPVGTRDIVVAPMPEYKVKGSHVVMANQWVDQRLGPGTFKALVEPNGEPWNGLLLPVTWYDVDPLQKALTVVAQKLGRSVEELTMEIAGENARKDLTTIYRIFMRIAAPHRVMANTPKLWSTYVKFGEARAVVNDSGHYIGECEGIPRHLLEWTCGAWRGFVPTAIELAGGKDVHAKILGTWASGHDLNRLQLEVRYR
jgi:hypothetical protein